nr:FHA domain-containing protein [Actinomycetota bacterium]
MHVAFEHGPRLSELHLRWRGTSPTVADLATALGLPPEQGLVVGDGTAPPDLSLSEARVHEGVVLRPSGGEATLPAPQAAMLLLVSGGLVSGPAWTLPVGVTTVGRDPMNDVVVDHGTVSGRHCFLTVDAEGRVEVGDLDSLNGTWVDDEPVVASRPLTHGAVLRAGAVRFSLADTQPRPGHLGSARRLRSNGTMAFNRPPRPAAPASPGPVGAPAAPTSPVSTPLSLVALVAPLGFAALMVAVMGRLVYALFALLGPVMALGTWLESRRRSGRTTKRQARRLAADMA